MGSLPLYFFSFYKAPTCVIKQLVKLQRNFLWGGGIDDRRVCWVKWDQICLPKEQGGLGVKDLTLFNKALLGKWKWRMLTEGDAVWAELLRSRYGHLPTNLVAGNTLSYDVKSSLWWRDIIGLDFGDNENWFMSNTGCSVGDGKAIGFWKMKWFGNQPFCELFPELFAKETFKEVLISDRMQGNGADRVWSWNWLQQLSFTKTQQNESLQELLFDFSLNISCHDRWKWKSGLLNVFLVRSAYFLLLRLRPVEELEATKLIAINKLWRVDVPSKVHVFGWRLLLNKLPTRLALNHRGILLNPLDLLCVFCSQNVEDSGHLVFSCTFSKGVWDLVSNWLGKRIPTGVD
jgi:hypothetical protein